MSNSGSARQRVNDDSAGVWVDQVHCTFNPGTLQEKRALNGIDCTLRPGDFTVVIGSNGAGKSTLLNALAGEVSIDTGAITINGASVHEWPAHKRARLISRVFQDPLLGTAAALSIEENLAVASMRGKTRGLTRSIKAADRERFIQRLSALGLGLEKRLDDRVDLLSGGQRQSLTLVMATLAQPELLLLDEHTAALDPRAADLVMKNTVETVERHHITTVMITHNMAQAVSYGNRLLMMHEGRFIFDVRGAEKAQLTVQELVARFHHVASDRMLLS